MHHIGFIGLGTMGAPMARNLLKAGFALRVFDIEPKAVQALVSAGATAATSAADAARGADCVITMLPNGEHVEEAAFGKGGAAETLKPGSLFIDMSTIAPSVTDRIAGKMTARGIAMLDAPVGRIGALGTWIGYAPSLENEILPPVENIVEEATRILAY